MKLKNSYRLIAGGAAVLLTGVVSAGSAFAQANVECLCSVPANSPGQIVTSSGDVRVSQANGFEPAGPGTPLSQSSRIIVSLQSEAEILIGSCRLRIPQNNDVLLDPQNGEICVRTEPANGQTAGQSATATVVVGGAAMVGSFVAIAVTEGDSVSD